MKILFAGLVLFSTIGTAQTTASLNTQPKEKLTAEKMRAVILADEREHEARGPISGAQVSTINVYHVQTQVNNRMWFNSSKTRYSPWLTGLGYGFTALKAFSRYNNSSNTDYESLKNYYRVPQSPPK